jgi:predicted metal-binding membrane protein
MERTGLSLQRDQRRVLGLLAVVCAASWSWSLRLAADMPPGPHHHADSLWPLTFMWGAMMVAMMVPPEVPRLLWLVRERRAPLAQALAFLVGYLAPWMVASLGAALLQARLGAAGLLTAEMATASRTLGGGLLLAAGVMELSPLKRACLERCRSRAQAAGPPGEGVAGPLLRGARHGVLSIGSCGVLMLVLFVTGVMSPLAMVLLTALLFLEAVAPRGWPVRWVAGLALLGWGAWLILV